MQATKPTYSKAVKSQVSPTKTKPGNYLAGMMKDLVKMNAHKATHPEILFGKLYLMVSDESGEVVWKGEVNKKEVFEELLQNLLKEELQEDFFKLVSLKLILITMNITIYCMTTKISAI